MINFADIPVKKLTDLPLSYYTENRTKVLDRLEKSVGESFTKHSLIFMKGHIQHMNNHDDDATSKWKPEANFLYLFGFPNVFDLYALLNIETGEVTVSIPKHEEIHKLFDAGLNLSTDPAKYGINKFIYNEDLQSEIQKLNPDTIYIMEGRNRFDNPSHIPRFDWLGKFSINKYDLYQALCAQRVIKTKLEINILREVTSISCEAHKYCMKMSTPGMSEFKIAELFKVIYF